MNTLLEPIRSCEIGRFVRFFRANYAYKDPAPSPHSMVFEKTRNPSRHGAPRRPRQKSSSELLNL
jgi:hypothetical protein